MVKDWPSNTREERFDLSLRATVVRKIPLVGLDEGTMGIDRKKRVRDGCLNKDLVLSQTMEALECAREYVAVATEKIRAP